MRTLTVISRLLLVCGFLLGAGRLAGQPQRPFPPRSSMVTPGPNEQTFLMLSDVHFDPLTGTSPQDVEALISAPPEKWQSIFESHAASDVSSGDADTNYALLVSALHAAAGRGVPFDYVIVTGDYLAHNFLTKYRAFRPDGQGYPEFAIKTAVFVSRMIEQSFPGIPIYGALGNNDSSSADYALPDKPFLTALAKEWKVVSANPYAAQDFLSGGYYEVAHPTVAGQEFIVLNTSLWSRLYTGGDFPGASDAGTAEMKWLASKLDDVSNRRQTAALIMHIPPGIDAYTALQAGNVCDLPTLFWKKPYLDSFLALLAAHKSSLRDSYAGHTHINDFRVFTDASGMPYFQMHIAPSISPNGGNSPAFEIGVYDKTTGALVDYSAIYSRNRSGRKPADVLWEPAFDFRAESGFPDYNPSSLETIALLIRSSDIVRARLFDLFSSRTSATLPIPSKDWLAYSCAQTQIAPKAFSSCACAGGSAPR